MDKAGGPGYAGVRLDQPDPYITLCRHKYVIKNETYAMIDVYRNNLEI